jgi:hypothetical protein
MSDEWDKNPLVVASRRKRQPAALTLERFFTRFEVVGCSLILHEYPHVLRAVVSAAERLDGGRIKLRLRAVRRAPKRKGHMLLGAFERGVRTSRTVNLTTYTVEDLGDGIYHFSAPGRKTYGFLIPGKRVYVASSQKHGPLLQTPPRGQLSLVSNG